MIHEEKNRIIGRVRPLSVSRRCPRTSYHTCLIRVLVNQSRKKREDRTGHLKPERMAKVLSSVTFSSRICCRESKMPTLRCCCQKVAAARWSDR